MEVFFEVNKMGCKGIPFADKQLKSRLVTVLKIKIKTMEDTQNDMNKSQLGLDEYKKIDDHSEEGNLARMKSVKE